jgi:hypothetical protein
MAVSWMASTALGQVDPELRELPRLASPKRCRSFAGRRLRLLLPERTEFLPHQRHLAPGAGAGLSGFRSGFGRIARAATPTWASAWPAAVSPTITTSIRRASICPNNPSRVTAWKGPCRSIICSIRESSFRCSASCASKSITPCIREATSLPGVRSAARPFVAGLARGLAPGRTRTAAHAGLAMELSAWYEGQFVPIPAPTALTATGCCSRIRSCSGCARC